jgi:hypothetical protein
MRLTPVQQALAECAPQDVAQAQAELNELSRRPAFFLACYWLSLLRTLRPAPDACPPGLRWVPVDIIQIVMVNTFGSCADDLDNEDEMAVAMALERHGVKLRLGSDDRLEADIDMQALLDVLVTARENGTKPRAWPTRARRYIGPAPMATAPPAKLVRVRKAAKPAGTGKGLT